MPREIAKQTRYRPFALKHHYDSTPSIKLTISAAEIVELIHDEQAFLADTGATVTYSLYERVKRQSLCESIAAKLIDDDDVTQLTNKEIAFILGMQKSCRT